MMTTSIQRSALACALGLAATIAVAACGHHAEDAPAQVAPEPSKDAITKTTENGPVKVTVRLWPAKPSLVDPLYVRLEVEAPAGIAIDIPLQDVGGELGRFQIEHLVPDDTRGADGGQHLRRTFTLLAHASGRQRIPPLRLEMTDARKATPETRPQEILTDELAFEIAPVSAEAAAAPLKAALGELDADVGGLSWVELLALIFGAAILGAGGVLCYRALRARRRVALQRSAYDEAVAELHALEATGAPDPAAADSWFVQLSAIVRRYLEQRYDIRAPELTTEEFLLVATARPELTAEHRALLTSFLERCDRVKFAGYRPDTDESIASLKAARGFVEDTRLREPIRKAA
ncbi:MAG TPA: hypothetical protein VGC42_08985 [Kofleriaceae bacterium]